MKIPQTKIDEISANIDIVDLISQYTKLKKSGKNFMGRCPFHQEKTPSFSVSQEKGVYNCFGCGKSGNIFTFIMDIDNVSFMESVKLLAQKANVYIELEEGSYKDDKNKLEALYEINKTAAKYFYDNLNSKEGTFAYEYLMNRGIKDKTINKFGLGFSLQSNDALTKYLLKTFKDTDIIESGMSINLGNQNLRDRFRGRLMIPILSESNRVIGFGGRKLFNDDTNEAKYINSPETKIYHKSKVLFGLNNAKNHIKDKGFVIIVEGYMDIIALYEHGFYNVIASSGTSLTDLQIKILMRYADEGVLIFDADIAGQNASRRGIEILLENNMKTSLIILPEGEDPDSYIRKFGKDKFEFELKNRKTVINYLVRRALLENKLTDPDSKGKFIREIIYLISKVSDNIKKELFIKEISEQTGIYENILRKELDNILINKRKGFTRPPQEQFKNDDEQMVINIEIKPLDKLLLKLLLEGDIKVKEYILNNIEIDFIEDKNIAKIVNLFCKNLKHKDRLNANYVMLQLQDKVINRMISEVLIDDNIYIKSADIKEAKTIINKFEIININKQIFELKNKIRSGSGYTENDLKKLNKLMKKKLDLEKPVV